MAQKKEPRRGDWYSDVQSILAEFEIHISETYIREMKSNSFKKLVKQKAFEAGFRYLRSKQMNVEKGRLINYTTLELQDYLQPCANISLEDQQLVFSHRCEINFLKTNFKRNIHINNEYCIKKFSKIIR